MTVKELVERLKEFDGDLKVVFSRNQVDADDFEILDVTKALGSTYVSTVYLWDE